MTLRIEEEPVKQPMTELAVYFPNQQLHKLMDDLVNVTSWDDFARRFLLGAGNSKGTTGVYLTACKQFYDFTGGLHPMQAGTPEWIEQWYDSLDLDLNTRAVKVAALKFMYRRICERFPFYESPFAAMPAKLQKKLSRSKKDESQKDALTAKECAALLEMLAQGDTLKDRQNHALVRFAIGSGLRAQEMVDLRWGDITEDEGKASATFTGKGAKTRTVQVPRAAIAELRRVFKERFGRTPQADDFVLNGLPAPKSKGRGLTKSAVHVRLKAIIEEAKQAGLIRANLHVSTHTMRHTYATRAVAEGVPLDVVQRQLGHANLATTARYLHNVVDMEEYFAKMAGEVA